MHAIYSHMVPFLAVDDATAMLRIAESLESFGTYADEASNDGLGEKLPQRFDAAFNYIAHGIEGAGNADDTRTASHRTNYFRETYAYGEEVRAPALSRSCNSATCRIWRARFRAQRNCARNCLRQFAIPGRNLPCIRMCRNFAVPTAKCCRNGCWW